MFMGRGFNPYFTGLPILIMDEIKDTKLKATVSILILLDYLFLLTLLMEYQM